MYSRRKLTKEQLKELNIATYEDEVVLYQKYVDPIGDLSCQVDILNMPRIT
jgi:hypothetical protein